MLDGNVIDYLAWRGDLSLIESPFNDVDNLILSLVVYLNFDEIVPSINSSSSISLYEAANRYYEINTPEVLAEDHSLIADMHLVLRAAMNSVRFKNAKLCKYYSLTDVEKEIQFAAMHINLDDGTTYIAYRGTDDSLIGWKEDFNMSYKMPVPSQIAATKYLNDTVSFGFRKYRIGGHSKGGNLAVYASVECDERIKNRIINVYSNDGPGFLSGMIESVNYQKMSSKIISIIPESSVVGLLLEHDEDYMIVKSNQIGLLQHDGLTWRVLGTKFVTLESISSDSRVIDNTLRNWLAEVDDEKREKFVNAIFDLLSGTGATKLSELNNLSIRKINNFVKGLSELDSDSKNMIMRALKLLTSEYGKIIKDYVQEKNID